MIYSSDIMEKVNTYDGITALRKDCRFIKGEFYIKNKQCFLIDGKWYRINSDRIVFDYENKVWIIKDSTIGLYYGVVEIMGSKTDYGYFTPNISRNVYLFEGKKVVPVLDENLFSGNTLFDEGMNGIYYKVSLKDSLNKDFTHKLRPRKEEFYSFPFNYGSEELIPSFAQVFSEKFVGDPLLSKSYRLLKDFTWGVEFETERGAIPERHLAKNGLIACRDGSISGFEYVTVPLSGERGIQEIKRACDLLHKYCNCSSNESLHIHIGGYPRNVEAIAALYRLCYIIQKEIYSLFPLFYADTAQFKRKSYCGPLYNVGTDRNSPEEIFAGIYCWLSNGENFRSFPKGPHPLDRSGQHKWEVSPRYIWLNLIPLIWGTRGTVEFRCHTPTFNSTKVINWLFIIVAILKYALNHSVKLTSSCLPDIKRISLHDILSEYYPEDITSILGNYMKQRKSYYAKNADPTGEHEIFDEFKNNEIFKLNPFV
jgi:hypothetical protein